MDATLPVEFEMISGYYSQTIILLLIFVLLWTMAVIFSKFKNNPTRLDKFFAVSLLMIIAIFTADATVVPKEYAQTDDVIESLKEHDLVPMKDYDEKYLKPDTIDSMKLLKVSGDADDQSYCYLQENKIENLTRYYSYSCEKIQR